MKNWQMIIFILGTFFYVAAAQSSMHIEFDENGYCMLTKEQSAQFETMILEERRPNLVIRFAGESESMIYDILPVDSEYRNLFNKRYSAIELNIDTAGDELTINFNSAAGEEVSFTLKLYDMT